jgi:hypothetical protein
MGFKRLTILHGFAYPIREWRNITITGHFMDQDFGLIFGDPAAYLNIENLATFYPGLFVISPWQCAPINLNGFNVIGFINLCKRDSVMSGWPPVFLPDFFRVGFIVLLSVDGGLLLLVLFNPARLAMSFTSINKTLIIAANAGEIFLSSSSNRLTSLRVASMSILSIFIEAAPCGFSNKALFYHGFSRVIFTLCSVL